jgi:hypothetical protein
MLLAAVALILSSAAAADAVETAAEAVVQAHSSSKERGQALPGGQFAFHIPNERANAAAALLHRCMLITARGVAPQAGPEAALDVARSYCWELRKEYRDALGPVAEAFLRKEGVANKIGEDALDMMAGDMLELDLQPFEAALLAKLMAG